MSNPQSMCGNNGKSETNSGEYGFFLDLESAASEHEQVQYYVVTTRTHYEVRRKFGKPPPIPPRQQILSISDAHKDSLENLANENNECETSGCFANVLSRIFRLPKDIYYSCLVCSVTVSCVYLVMSWPESTNVE